jgi:ABC-type branched-subunit amino acid transport system ATPase component
MTGDVLLEAVNLIAGYDRVPVVRGIDIRVGSGEIVSLLGANGAGKSTTLKTLIGALPAIDGVVRWRGIADNTPLHKRVIDGLGYVPERRGVFMQLTVEENLRVGQGPVDNALELFPELDPHLKRKAGDLSGGQQQILSLARVLSASPAVLVADELSLGLAPIVVRRLLGALVEAAERGVGVLIVEQHAELVLEISTRAYVLRRGLVVAEGPAADFRGRADELHRMYMADDTGH